MRQTWPLSNLTSSSVSADFLGPAPPDNKAVKNQGKFELERGDATVVRVDAAVTETCFRPLAAMMTTRRLLLPTVLESQRDRLQHSTTGEFESFTCGRAGEAGSAMMAMGAARATRSILNGHSTTARTG